MLSIGYGYVASIPLLIDINPSPDNRTYTLISERTNYGAHAKGEYSYGHLGLGVSLNRSSMNLTYVYASPTGNIKDTVDLLEIVQNINCRVNYHFLKERFLDPYIGFGAGLSIVNARTKANNIPIENDIPIGFEATVGLRFLIMSRVGIYAEYGFGRTLYQGGISINFGHAPVK